MMVAFVLMPSEFLSLTPQHSDSEDFGDEIVVIDSRNGTFFSLKGRAASLWRAVSRGLAKSEMESWIESLTDSSERELLRGMAGRFLEGNLWSWDSGEDSEATREDLESDSELPAYFEANDDFEELIRLDPIHDVTEGGWLGARKENSDNESEDGKP